MKCFGNIRRDETTKGGASRTGFSPAGIPLVYELDSDLKRVRHYYLADENMLKDAMAEVAKQGKAK
jgi:hypothetical protein